MAILTMLLLAVFVGGVSARSTGPPLAACGTLTPGHTASTGNENPVPYEITVVPAMYGPGDTITVTLAQNAPMNSFKGFMIQARRTSVNMDDAIGTFMDPAPTGTQLLNCPEGEDGSTWAHSNSDAKSTVTSMWIAPATDEGNLAFRATVVVRNDGTSTYYTNIMSAELTYNGPTQAPTTTDSSVGVVRASLLVTAVTLLVIAMFGRLL